MAHWSKAPSGLAAAALLGGSIGVGARLIKQLLDERKRKVQKLPSTETRLPVEISPEEALELERKGVDVKLAEVSSFSGGVVRGALGVGAGVGMYKLVDHLLHRARQKELRSDIDRLQQRIQATLEDRPEEEDQGLHRAMKIAEEQYFSKKAGPIFNFLDSQIPSPLGALAGGAGLLALLSSFKRVGGENVHAQRVSELRRMLATTPGPSRLALEPVTSRDKLLAIITKHKGAPKSKPKTVDVEAEVVRDSDEPQKSGSPAQQASTSVF